MMDETILTNYLQGACDVEECKKVEEWSKHSPENRHVLEQLYCTLFISRSMSVIDKVDTESSLKQMKQRVNRQESTVQTKRFKINLRIALMVASAFLIGVISSVALIASKTVDYSVSTVYGQRAQTTLPDGSKVWLNGASEIKYHDSFWSSSRQVELTGEAYFEVEHKKGLPFEVTSKGYKVNVLGTKFNVRAREEDKNIITTLFEGSVMVNSQTIDSEYMLVPGQTLNINTATQQAQILEYTKPVDVLLWIDGRLEINNHSLKEITEIIETLYDVRFVFEDESLKAERFTGVFSTDNSPEEILKVLTYTNYFNYRIEGHTIYLKRR